MLCFSKKEINEIDQDTERRYQEIKQSIDNQRRAIQNCLVEHEGEEGVDKVKDWLDKIEIK